MCQVVGLWTMGPPRSAEVPRGGLDFGSLWGRGFSWAAWHSVWPGSGPEQPACLPLPASLPWDQRQSWDTARHSTLSVYLSIIPLHSLHPLSFSSQSFGVIVSLFSFRFVLFITLFRLFSLYTRSFFFFFLCLCSTLQIHVNVCLSSLGLVYLTISLYLHFS